jgi:hypothetical protein
MVLSVNAVDVDKVKRLNMNFLGDLTIVVPQIP